MTRFIVVLLGALALSGMTPAMASAAPIGAPSSSAHHSGRLSFSGYTWKVHSRGHWAATHTRVAHGVLNLSVSGHKGGGVSMATSRTYGHYSLRFRMGRGAGKYVFLLWPSHCPKGPPSHCRPEIDFGEDNVGDSARANLNATYHPKPGCSACTHLRTRGNFSNWHSLGLNWSPSGLSFILDGRTWAHLGANVHTSMHLSIQANPLGSGPPATLQVSSVHVS